MSESFSIARARLEQSLREAVAQGVAPGAVAACARFVDGSWQSMHACAGALEPGGAAVAVDTPYDLASVTKPFVAMTALRLSTQGQLDLNRELSAYVPELSGTHGGGQTLSALLSHRAGLSPWGGMFHALPGPVASAETRAFLLHAAATSVDPNPPLEGSVYSDLGYLLSGEAVARASGLPLADAVEREVTGPLGIDGQVRYAAALSPQEKAWLEARVAPTEYCAWRGRVIRGEVHDENCAAFGGIAGHAGLFGPAGAVLRFGMAMLDVLAGRSNWIDRETLRFALTPQPGGGHVLGWDTKSEAGSSAGELFSALSFGHLGFTGTSIWCDPEHDLCAVLLTNRVHTTRDNILIRSYRPRFHDEAHAALMTLG